MAIDLSAQLATVEASLAKAQARLDDMLDQCRPTYTVDGETFKTTEYQAFLVKTIKELERRQDLLSRALTGEGFQGTQAFA